MDSLDHMHLIHHRSSTKIGHELLAASFKSDYSVLMTVY